MPKKELIFAIIVTIICCIAYISIIYISEARGEIPLSLTSSLSPPPGNCKEGEVWRCIMGPCFSTLLYCLPVYENGIMVNSGGCNKTTCSWNCECIKKDKPIETNQE